MSRRNLTTLIDALKGVGALKQDFIDCREDYKQMHADVVELHADHAKLATAVVELATAVTEHGTAIANLVVRVDEGAKRLDKVETKVDDLITLVELHAVRNFTQHQYRSIASLLAARAKKSGIKPGSKMIPGRGPQRAYPVAFAHKQLTTH
jgi:hypothetical protein